jgi:hypothetical protein
MYQFDTNVKSADGRKPPRQPMTPEKRAKMEAGKQRRKEERFNILAGRASGDVLPGITRWDQIEQTSLGRKMTGRERQALSEAGCRWLNERAIDLLEYAYAIVKGTIKTDRDDGPRIALLRQIVGTILPAARVPQEEQSESKVTRIVIGAPLKRLIEKGVTVAAEVREGDAANE